MDVVVGRRDVTTDTAHTRRKARRVEDEVRKAVRKRERVGGGVRKRGRVGVTKRKRERKERRVCEDKKTKE